MTKILDWISGRFAGIFVAPLQRRLTAYVLALGSVVGMTGGDLKAFEASIPVFIGLLFKEGVEYLLSVYQKVRDKNDA